MGEFRRSAWLIAAAALFPLLLFLVLESAFGAREEQRNIEAKALSTSASVMIAVDGEVKRHLSSLVALATAHSLRNGDIPEFHARALELLTLNEGWRGVELVDEDNGGTLTTAGSGPWSVMLTSRGKPGLEPRFAGFARGPHCPCLVFERRASSPPGKDWALRLMIGSEELLAALPAAHSEFEISAVVDANGRFVARSLNNAQRFGQLGSPALRRAVASGAGAGTYRGQTLEGTPTYSGFARSPLTGWSAHAAYARHLADNPAMRFFASIGAAAILSILLAAVLIWFALRQVAASRRIAERMQQAQKLEALGQLTGGIAHDFNNLLTPVVGALDFVAKKPTTDPSSKRLLDAALASAQRASKLTTQLLAFSRRQKLAIVPIHLASMVEAMNEMLRQAIGNQHTLEFVQADQSLCAMSDLNQLELAVLNLMLNARDASPAGSPIRLAISGTGDPKSGSVMISVTDVGSGMDKAVSERALEPFFTTKEVGRGTGLGLAQVFGTATQSGGELSISSELGRGTCVTLKLRRCPCIEPSPPPKLAGDSSTQRPLRLLVVDDDPHVRAMIVRPLEDSGHIVDSVSDGRTALAAIEQQSFDLMLVDFLMPGMSGAELIRRAKTLRPGQRFLIVSGYSDSEAIAAAATDTPVLSKPFVPDDLVAAVERFSA